MKKPDTRLARLLLTGATFLYSTDALLIRIAGTSPAVPFYRSLFACISLFLLFSLEKKNPFAEFKKGGPALILSCFLLSLCSLGFSYSVQKAGAAIPLIYLSLSPLMASLISFVFLKEKPKALTVVAIFLSIAGIVIMNFRGNAGAPLSGHLLSMLSPTALAVNFTLLRKHKDFDRKLICATGNLINSFYALLICRGNVAIPSSSILPMLIVGLAVVPFGQVSMNTATKYLPSFEVSLINSLEGVFGLLWIFIILGERPTTDAIIGGSIVFLAIVINTLQDAKKPNETNA
jgi:Permeases of the drug/metabolite transporter (DMT) superfamily